MLSNKILIEGIKLNTSGPESMMLSPDRGLRLKLETDPLVDTLLKG